MSRSRGGGFNIFSKAMKPRSLAIIAGMSYIIIFFAAIFANFLVLAALKTSPMAVIEQSGMMVRLGILAFLFTVLFDVVIAWALFELFKKHPLTGLSTLFRMMHAAIMGVALFALPMVFNATSDMEALAFVNMFNTIWLIGLFFFGMHLILLGKILTKPRVIAVFLMLAGVMYMVDTCAHFLMLDYTHYANIFLALVAIPSILGEMAFAIWLLIKGGREVERY